MKTGLTEDEDAQKSSYCRVSLEDFVTDKNMEMDVYVKLSEEKFIKIAHMGGKIAQHQLDNYLKKGITHLYIQKSDFSKVLGFNIKLNGVVAKSNKIPAEKKKRFLTNTANVILEDVYINGFDEEAFKESKSFVMDSLEVLTEDKEVFSMLEILNSHVDHLYSHSLGVSLYSVMIAKALGYQRTLTHFNLSFGGLMHDIGKKEIDPSLLEKSRVELSFKERAFLETHVARGKEILESIKAVPSDVVSIAYEHHEDCLGQGFPRQLSKDRIHPLARIVSIADIFCNYALKNNHHDGMEANKALKMMEDHKVDLIDAEYFRGLKSLIEEPQKHIEKLSA